MSKRLIWGGLVWKRGIAQAGGKNQLGGLFDRACEGLGAAVNRGLRSISPARHPNRPEVAQVDATQKWGEKWGRTRKTLGNRMDKGDTAEAVTAQLLSHTTTCQVISPVLVKWQTSIIESLAVTSYPLISQQWDG